MANYFVSGIYKDNEGISHVYLHTNDEKGALQKGKLYTLAEGINILENVANTIRVILWDYHIAWFKTGDLVKVIERKGKKYLRSHKDNTVNDNLENLIRVYWFNQ